MILHFGLAFDDVVYAPVETSGAGYTHTGPKGLLGWMETWLGLAGLSANMDYLRIEQYRQALRLYLNEQPNCFYSASFQADPFATAAALLERRDELLLAGWSFQPDADFPDRLQVFAALETHFREGKLQLYPGWADRWMAVEKALPEGKIPLEKLVYYEPETLLPGHFSRLLAILEQKGIPAAPISLPDAVEDTDLGTFQKALKGSGLTKQPLRKDGSLLILRAPDEHAAAAFVSRLLREHPHWQPALLIPEKSLTLDHALLQEGLPGMGLLSASLARPSLQILKLVPVFLWRPIDPFKIMEFVSLAVKPLEAELADIIAGQIAQTPGLRGEGWNIAISRYFDNLEERAAADASLDPAAIRREYQFWFERPRYDIAGRAPKAEAWELFDYLYRWAIKLLEDTGASSLVVLADQARRVRELLEALPEEELTFLELERIVRTIYEPSPVQFSPREKGSLDFVHHPGGFAAPPARILWWNFVEREKPHFFSRWYPAERKALESTGIRLSTPETENQLQLWHRYLPVRLARKQITFVIPAKLVGDDANAHPLWGNLEACFQDLPEWCADVSPGADWRHLRPWFALPKTAQQTLHRLGRPKPWLSIQAREQWFAAEGETFTSLNTFLYRPYQWLFRYKARLVKSPILSIVGDNTLKGNLAHRLFEKLLRQDLQQLNKAAVENWIDREASNLLVREGAVLLMYGREPDRVYFLNKVKQAAWVLVDLIRSNGWQVKHTEMDLAGEFVGRPMKGIADLVLERPGEMAILDLKWRGATYRTNMIRNEEDLQLALYAHLLAPDTAYPHTAYFIIEKGKLIARNKQAFQHISPVVSDDADHREIYRRVLQRMEATYHWRRKQILEGAIEVRSVQTLQELDEHYESEDLNDFLELPRDDDPFDDYRTLINGLT